MKWILFVYGTLKRQQRNHGLLTDQSFLGEAVTVPRYRLFDLGPYPGIIRAESNGRAIQGELYAVSECCLAELDDFEGVPDLFVRDQLEVAGYDAEVWAYYFSMAVPESAPEIDCWPPG